MEGLVFNIPIILNLFESTAEDEYRLERVDWSDRGACEFEQEGHFRRKLTKQCGVDSKRTIIWKILHGTLTQKGNMTLLTRKEKDYTCIEEKRNVLFPNERGIKTN